MSHTAWNGLLNIADCHRAYLQDFNESVTDIGSREVMEMMLITQYFDTLRDLGAHGKGSTVFVPHQPGTIADIGGQIRSGFMQAAAAQEMHR
jgi:hypothetical protein